METKPRNRDEREIMGYRDVLNTIHENFEYIPIHSGYILQLHRDLYQYSEKGIMELCPSVGKTSIENALKKLVEDGVIIRHGKGKSTFYTRSDAE